MRNLGGSKIVRLKATVKPTLPVGNVPNSYRKVGLRLQQRGFEHTSVLRGQREQTEAPPCATTRRIKPSRMDFKLLPDRIETARHTIQQHKRFGSFKIGRLAKLQINLQVTYMDNLTGQGSQDMTFVNARNDYAANI